MVRVMLRVRVREDFAQVKVFCAEELLSANPFFAKKEI